jgi:hypothetical protein
MRKTLTSIWTNAYACFFCSPLALFGSGVFFFLALSEAFANFQDSCRNIGSDCHEPNDLLILGLGGIGLVLLVLAVTWFLRLLVLLGQSVVRRLRVG